jgi:hypothetical protein
MLINKKRNLYSIIILIGIMGSIILFINLFIPQKTNLQFQTIEKGESTKANKPTEPEIFVITNNNDYLHLRGFISPDSEELLKTLNYDNFFVLMVFQGLKPNSGYGIEIKVVTKTKNIVTLFTKFDEPKPDLEKSPEIRSPYHLIQIKKISNWDQEIEFHMVVQGQVVVSQTFFIP